MKEKGRKIIIFWMLVSTLLVIGTQTAMSEATDLTTLNYLEEKIIMVPGNITLWFTSSDMGTDDITLIWRIYNYESDMTVYDLNSMEITYDYSFVNDTKKYNFVDNITGNEYRIKIDYSCIEVPKSQEQILNETLIEKELRLQELNLQIEDLQNNITVVQQQLNETLVLADRYKNDSDTWMGQVGELNARIYDYEMTLDRYINETRYLEYQRGFYENQTMDLSGTITTLQDPWHAAINLPSLIGGILLVGGGVFYFLYRKHKIPFLQKKNIEPNIPFEERQGMLKVPHKITTGLQKEIDAGKTTPKKEENKTTENIDNMHQFIDNLEPTANNNQNIEYQ